MKTAVWKEQCHSHAGQDTGGYSMTKAATRKEGKDGLEDNRSAKLFMALLTYLQADACTT
jgi:hypothetical protein